MNPRELLVQPRNKLQRPDGAGRLAREVTVHLDLGSMSFVTTPRGLYEQVRTANHPQDGRAQHSPRAQARAKI